MAALTDSAESRQMNFMFRFTGEHLIQFLEMRGRRTTRAESGGIIGRLHVSRGKFSPIAGGSGFEEVTVVVTEIDVDGAQAEAGSG
jgi:hypothetical protein